MVEASADKFRSPGRRGWIGSPIEPPSEVIEVRFYG